MKKYFIFMLLAVIITVIALFGCEKKKTAPPPTPAVQPIVTPPAPEPAPAPTPAPVPAKPAKK